MTIHKNLKKKRYNTLDITYGFAETPYGAVVLAKTDRGVCWLGFQKSDDTTARYPDGVSPIHDMWPGARIVEGDIAAEVAAINTIIKGEKTDILFDLYGTDFQMTVWQDLLTIPRGQVVSYRDIAARIGKPSAMRAVGNAIAANPVSLAIPCHRVVAASGKIHHYAWGAQRKADILRQEKAIS